MSDCTTCGRYENCYERHTIEKCKGQFYLKTKIYCTVCGKPMNPGTPWKNICDHCRFKEIDPRAEGGADE